MREGELSPVQPLSVLIIAWQLMSVPDRSLSVFIVGKNIEERRSDPGLCLLSLVLRYIHYNDLAGPLTRQQDEVSYSEMF